MPNCWANILPNRAKGYLKNNWGAPFIATFITLLSAAAVFVLLGWFSLADAVAVYGFYALVAGVVLQFACSVRHGANGSERA